METSWIVQIYQVADDHTQAFISGVLSGHSIIVTPVDSDFDHYVVVDCKDDDQAFWVFELVMSIDVDAVLLHASSGSTAAYEMEGPHEFA
jgi:hypothetical protein